MWLQSQAYSGEGFATRESWSRHALSESEHPISPIECNLSCDDRAQEWCSALSYPAPTRRPTNQGLSVCTVCTHEYIHIMIYWKWPFQQTRVALFSKRVTSLKINLKQKKTMSAHLPCLSVWNPTEIFHTMFLKIVRRPNEIEPILFPFAPGNKLTIHFPTDFETVNNLNLGRSAGEILMNSGFGFSGFL